MQKIIVDGYNVIHADASLKRAVAGGMEVAREALLARLREYLASKAVQITVVFDGAGGLVDAEAPVPGRLQVLYTAAGQSADELIVETLQLHANPRQFIVVTSDMSDIGRAAGAVGATVMSSPEFLDRLSARPAAAEPHAGSEKPRPSEEDVGYWLERFGDGKTGDRDE
jgi:predicted RNA-binding protein with PIN domain